MVFVTHVVELFFIYWLIINKGEQNVSTCINITLDETLSQYMSHPAIRPTLWPLRNVSTYISQSSPLWLIRADTFRLRVDRGIE